MKINKRAVWLIVLFWLVVAGFIALGAAHWVAGVIAVGVILVTLWSLLLYRHIDDVMHERRRTPHASRLTPHGHVHR